MRCHPRKRAWRATGDPGPRPGSLNIRSCDRRAGESLKPGDEGQRRASVEEDQDGGLIASSATARSVLLRGGGHGMPGADAWLEHSEEGTRGFFDIKAGSQ